jgi:hypothetical protein
MKSLSIFVLLALSGPLAMSATLKGDVYSPKAGIVCDKKAHFCADDQGISLAFTKEYLGAKAEAIMLGRIKEAGGPGNYDMTWFGFSNGVDCKVKEKLCRVSKHSDKADTAHTKALFGR